MNLDALASEAAHKTVFGIILYAISFCHLLNDLVQSLIPSIYPILKGFVWVELLAVGLLTLTYQLTASLLQPFIGLYTDRRAAAVLVARRGDVHFRGGEFYSRGRPASESC